MARKARIRALSGVYYIRLDSVSPLFLFEDDYPYFINLLKSEKENDFIEVYAYCLIEDSAHLVVKEGLSGISGNLMRVKSRYAAYYNSKYSKNGPLFKGRFFSVPLEENADIIKYVRLTHRIPAQFGRKFNFEGSSYPVYFKPDSLLSSKEIVSFFKSASDFKIFTEKDDEKTQEETVDKNKEKELLELKKKIKRIFQDVDPKELESLTPAEYAILFKRIKQLTKAADKDIAAVLEIDVNDLADI